MHYVFCTFSQHTNTRSLEKKTLTRHVVEGSNLKERTQAEAIVLRTVSNVFILPCKPSQRFVLSRVQSKPCLFFCKNTGNGRNYRWEGVGETPGCGWGGVGKNYFKNMPLLHLSRHRKSRMKSRDRYVYISDHQSINQYVLPA